jgi:hypothetical protein
MGDEVAMTSSPYTVTPVATQWLVALCYPSDQASIVPSRDQTFYKNLFGGAPGTGNAQEYWDSMSYETGSNHMFTGTLSAWTSTGHPLSWHQQQSRATNIQTCANAVLNSSTAYSSRTFYNYIAVYNGQLDEGAAGTTIQNQNQTGVIIDSFSPQTGILHEMGHGWGLPHSFNDQGVEYGDPDDIMSALNVNAYPGNYCVPPGSWYGCDNGPGVNAWTRWQLGWLSPLKRQMFWPFTAGSPSRTETLMLSARNEPMDANPKILYVPASATTMYTAEWIESDNYDRGISNTLNVHKIVYGDQRPQLVTESGGRQTDSTTPFYDSATGVHIALVGSSGSTATVKITVDTNNAVWGSGAPNGTPPVDSSKVWWAGVNVAGGDSAVPPSALYAGFDPSVGDLYPCRTFYEGGVHLGKVVWGECSIPWGGGEHFEKQLFEVLSVPNSGVQATWVNGSNGSMPSNALAAGFDGGNTLYVCRAQVNGWWTPGKFIWGSCDVSFGGTETFYHTYQVLTVQ